MSERRSSLTETGSDLSRSPLIARGQGMEFTKLQLTQRLRGPKEARIKFSASLRRIKSKLDLFADTSGDISNQL
jgi:hypothetical protein